MAEQEELTDIELDVVECLIGMKELKYPLHYDPEKLKYNSKYRCSEFFAQRFPNGWQSFPGFDKVIELCRSNASKISPLQEMEMRCVDCEYGKVSVSER